MVRFHIDLWELFKDENVALYTTYKVINRINMKFGRKCIFNSKRKTNICFCKSSSIFPFKQVSGIPYDNSLSTSSNQTVSFDSSTTPSELTGKLN